MCYGFDVQEQKMDFWMGYDFFVKALFFSRICLFCRCTEQL